MLKINIANKDTYCERIQKANLSGLVLSLCDIADVQKELKVSYL